MKQTFRVEGRSHPLYWNLWFYLILNLKRGTAAHVCSLLNWLTLKIFDLDLPVISA
jgi:hypothetical protein